MQLRCYRCGWSFAIKQEEIAFALQALEQDGGGHYDVRCPRCRHANRLSIQQLQRAAPRRRADSPEQSPPSAETDDPSGKQASPSDSPSAGADPDAAPKD